MRCLKISVDLGKQRSYLDTTTPQRYRTQISPLHRHRVASILSRPGLKGWQRGQLDQMEIV